MGYAIFILGAKSFHDAVKDFYRINSKGGCFFRRNQTAIQKADLINQIRKRALESLGEVDQLKVPDPPEAPLDLRDCVAVDIPTNALAGRC